MTACFSCQWVRVLICNIFTRVCPEIKILWPTCTSSGFLILFILVSISFSSFSFLLAAVIDLLLGMLAVKKLPRKRHRDGHFFIFFYPCVVAGNFALCFSLCQHFELFCAYLRFHQTDWSLWSGYHWKIYLLLLQKLSLDNANFDQKWWHQKWKRAKAKCHGPLRLALESMG